MIENPSRPYSLASRPARAARLWYAPVDHAGSAFFQRPGCVPENHRGRAASCRSLLDPRRNLPPRL